MSRSISVCPVDGIGIGEAKVVDAEETGIGTDISVFHSDDGQFYALDDECTHGAASLAEGWIEAGEVECPLHSSRFCLKTGKVLCLPATKNARTHKVEVRDGTVLLYPGVPAVDE